jgi:hypothetical protein
MPILSNPFETGEQEPNPIKRVALDANAVF